MCLDFAFLVCDDQLIRFFFAGKLVSKSMCACMNNKVEILGSQQHGICNSFLLHWRESISQVFDFRDGPATPLVPPSAAVRNHPYLGEDSHFRWVFNWVETTTLLYKGWYMTCQCLHNTIIPWKHCCVAWPASARHMAVWKKSRRAEHVCFFPSRVRASYKF